MDTERLAETFKALGDPHRLRALRFIAGGPAAGDDCGQAVCACHVQEHLDISQPATSYHLKVLRQAGLVDSEKRGRWVHYRISPKELEAQEEFLRSIDEAEGGRPEAVA